MYLQGKIGISLAGQLGIDCQSFQTSNQYSPYKSKEITRLKGLALRDMIDSRQESNHAGINGWDNWSTNSFYQEINNQNGELMK